MTDIIKPLGQVAPGATTEEVLYTAPDLTQTTCSSLWVCNRGGTSTTFRVSVSVDGAATANKDYLFYDTAIDANITRKELTGMTLSEGDVVRVYAGNANLSFNLFGVETVF